MWNVASANDQNRFTESDGSIVGFDLDEHGAVPSTPATATVPDRLFNVMTEKPIASETSNWIALSFDRRYKQIDKYEIWEITNLLLNYNQLTRTDFCPNWVRPTRNFTPSCPTLDRRFGPLNTYKMLEKIGLGYRFPTLKALVSASETTAKCAFESGRNSNGKNKEKRTVRTECYAAAGSGRLV